MWWWLGAAVVLASIEVLSVDLFFIMAAGGALAAALSFSLNENLPLSFVVFSIVTLILLLVVRPPLKKYLKASTPGTPMHTDALVGEEAVVTTAVNRDGGQVKIAGEIWSARSSASDEGEYDIDTRLFVQRIDGATAVVGPHKVEFEPHTNPYE